MPANHDEVLLELKKFTVIRRDVRLADGSEHNFEIVRHPGAAVVLPVLADGRIVLIANSRPAVNQELLELPAGTLEPPEPPRECAARELAEETGYRAGALRPLLSFYSSPGFCSEYLHVFVATQLSDGPAAQEAGEQIRLAPLGLADAVAAIRAGRIVDGKTIAALLYYERFVCHEQRTA